MGEKNENIPLLLIRFNRGTHYNWFLDKKFKKFPKTIF